MTLADLLSYAGIRPDSLEPLWTLRITLALYALTGLLALWQLGRAPQQRRFYGLLALLLFGLGLMRHLRWLEALTTEARMVAMVQGWYNGRHVYQQQLIRWGIGVGAIGLVGVLWQRRHQPYPQQLILVGITYQITFLLVQAISFHNLDSWLRRLWEELTYGTLLEWVGLLLIGVGLLSALVTRRQ